jgi:haloalkane dehalogenase
MLAHREEGPADGPVALLVHGYPESSYMWRQLMPPIAAAGWRAVAPDLAGYGDSPPDPPGTWERHVESLSRFHEQLELGPVALVVHDWGGMIGLAWACEHPELVSALVISDTGFFSDGKWHGMARAMREPGTGEELMENMSRDTLATMLRQASTGIGQDAIDEYWRGFEGEARRHGHLELYRSLDFEQLARYDGQLAALGVPALILWGETDPFAPVAGAERFHRELPDSELVVVPGAGHFVFEDAPERAAEAVVAFLGRAGAGR